VFIEIAPNPTVGVAHEKAALRDSSQDGLVLSAAIYFTTWDMEGSLERRQGRYSPLGVTATGEVAPDSPCGEYLPCRSEPEIAFLVLHCLGIRSVGATPTTVQSTKLDLCGSKTAESLTHEIGECNELQGLRNGFHERGIQSRVGCAHQSHLKRCRCER